LTTSNTNSSNNVHSNTVRYITDRTHDFIADESQMFDTNSFNATSSKTHSSSDGSFNANWDSSSNPDGVKNNNFNTPITPTQIGTAAITSTRPQLCPPPHHQPTATPPTGATPSTATPTDCHFANCRTANCRTDTVSADYLR
jgi:hypothetical protein